MPQPTAIDKLFGAVDDAYDVLLDSLKAGVDRGHRVSKGLIDQAQTSQHEALQLRRTSARLVVASPTRPGSWH